MGYLPFGIDLSLFVPLKYSPRLFMSRHPHLEDKYKIVYSGGLWYVNGKDVLGIEKLLYMFKNVEPRRGDVVLLLQISHKVMEMAKEIGIK